MTDFTNHLPMHVSITDHRLACDARDRALEELASVTKERDWWAQRAAAVNDADMAALIRERDHYRSQLGESAALIDSLTGQLASLSDKRTTVSLTRALKLLQDVMYGLRRYTGAPAENALHAEARAFLAEQGMRRVDTEMAEANKKWLARR